MTKTRAIILCLVATIAVATSVWLAIRPDDVTAPPVVPEVINVGSTEVTIAWRGEQPTRGTVWYKPVAGRGKPASVSDDLGADTRHEVVIAGLQPGTRYTYWLDQAQADWQYEFQTAPLAETPCCFLLTWGDVSGEAAGLIMSELPEFALSLTPIELDQADSLKPVRPYMPVYDLAGASSPYLRSAAGSAPPTEDKAWTLDWGGLRLVILASSQADLPALLHAPAAHTVGIIHNAAAANTWLIEGTLDHQAVRASPLHRAILAHNQTRTEGKAAFVLIPAAVTDEAIIDGVRYVALPAAAAPAAVRVDVAAESSQLVFLAGEDPRTIPLRQPALQQKRSCADCRRLANRGAYEESITAYKKFIADNQGDYQIDDAYYAIAEILDERLFRFADAKAAYNEFLTQYPDSTLAPMARRRVEYIQAHADFDYKPLEQFERIRRVEFARSQRDPHARDTCLADVQAVLEAYPACSIAPTITYWLANQYRQRDPDQAAAFYRMLLEGFPTSGEARRAWLEMGETYYNAAQYDKALAVFTEALAANPANEKELRTQMRRAQRNIRRRHLALASWALLGAIALLALLVPPVGLTGPRIAPTATTFVLLFIALLAGGWLIREQFASTTEMLLLSAGLAAAAALPAPLSAALARKACHATPPAATRPRQAASATIACLLGLASFAAAAYLLLYYVNEHYLVVAGL